MATGFQCVGRKCFCVRACVRALPSELSASHCCQAFATASSGAFLENAPLANFQFSSAASILLELFTSFHFLSHGFFFILLITVSYLPYSSATSFLAFSLGLLIFLVLPHARLLILLVRTSCAATTTAARNRLCRHSAQTHSPQKMHLCCLVFAIRY